MSLLQLMLTEHWLGKSRVVISLQGSILFSGKCPYKPFLLIFGLVLILELYAKKENFKTVWIYCTQSSLLILRGCCTSDDLDQLSCDNGLASTIEEDLEFSDHISGVLGCILCLMSVYSKMTNR
jgi:hypothetical protein